MLCKTLKKHATPAQLEKFLQEALAFHNLPPHTNLAQVVCAASFGKFEDPATVKDFPLICYRHQGFGNLRKFLQNCREGDKKGLLLSSTLIKGISRCPPNPRVRVPLSPAEQSPVPSP